MTVMKKTIHTILAAFLFCATAHAQTIFKIAGTGINGYTGDGGPAILAALTHPEWIDVDLAGNVYILDNTNSRIRKVAVSDTITLFAGTTTGFSGDGGPATAAMLKAPNGIACDGADRKSVV